VARDVNNEPTIVNKSEARQSYEQIQGKGIRDQGSSSTFVGSPERGVKKQLESNESKKTELV
jgi:hypothetical protein